MGLISSINRELLQIIVKAATQPEKWAKTYNVKFIEKKPERL